MKEVRKEFDLRSGLKGGRIITALLILWAKDFIILVERALPGAILCKGGRGGLCMCRVQIYKS
jgi:hypothetical protein